MSGSVAAPGDVTGSVAAPGDVTGSVAAPGDVTGSAPAPLLVRGGHVGSRRVDVLIEGGLIRRVAPAIAPRRHDQVLDAAGGTLLPGLHDHHVHLRAWAAMAGSVQVGPPQVVDPAGLGAALRHAPRGAEGWIRAVGYHQSVAGDLDRWSLDRLAGCGPRGGGPIRLQHRSGALWVLNSAAVSRLGLDAAGGPEGVERDAQGRATGRLWRADRWLGARVPRPHADLGAVSAMAASRGITGFTDATPDQDADDLRSLAEAARLGTVGQRLHLMAPADIGTDAGALAGPDHGAGRVSIGPVKLMLDDDRLPSIDSLAGSIAAAHERRRPVAIHCVTRIQAVVALAALAEARTIAGDRIEHGAVLGVEQLAQLRALHLTVVTQPAFVRARGDRYLADVDPGEQGDLWRVGSLLAAGVAVALSTDAPLGPVDPWAAIGAAADRRTATDNVLGAGEAVGFLQGVALFTGWSHRPARPRRIAPGQPGDLCILAQPPATLGLPASSGGAPTVSATVVAGRVLHQP